MTQRKPSWIKSHLPSNENIGLLRHALKQRKLCTVCTEARCPNLGECWEAKTATLMLMGEICTRACRFCDVKTGNPQGILDIEEPRKIVEMVKLMNLRYVVLTSVDRDDLPDGGARHFAEVVQNLRRELPSVQVEALIPDFSLQSEALNFVGESGLLVLAHNIEVVERLSASVRDKRASYERSLAVLKYYHEHFPSLHLKSSLMLGLGEREEEILKALEDLRRVGTRIVTLGQYLRPGKWNLEVERYYTPEEFERYKKIALDLGFAFVASGPLVRSSYRASDYLKFLETQSGT